MAHSQLTGKRIAETKESCCVIQGSDFREETPMADKRRFKAWNIVDPGLNQGSNGHHYWEAKALVDELRSRGETIRLFSHRDAPRADRFPGVEIIPTFSLNPWDDVSNDPVWSNFENFIVHARSIHSDLSAKDPSLFRHALALFPSLKGTQLLGLFRWLNDLIEKDRPKTAVCLFAPLVWSERHAQLQKTLWDACPPPLKKELALFCRTPQVAEGFKTHTDIALGVLPSPLPADAIARGRSFAKPAEAPMVVSFVGGARRERGGTLIADVVERCSASGVRFFIQAKHESRAGTGSDVLAGLARWPHVQVQEGVLEQDDYYRAIADSVLLLAYHPYAYRWRDSGVYREAVLLGAPVLVTAGTWMAQEVEQRGNGLVIKDFSVGAIVDCIGRAQRELPALRAAAARVAEHVSRTQGVASYISTVLGAFEGVREAQVYRH
jgi:hypothetical protein